MHCAFVTFRHHARLGCRFDGFEMPLGYHTFLCFNSTKTERGRVLGIALFHLLALCTCLHCNVTIVSLHSLIGDFGKSKNKWKWFNIMVQFLIMMSCICAKLVSVAHANPFIKSHWIYSCVFLVLYLKSMSLSSLKIMKKSPITKYSDLCTRAWT